MRADDFVARVLPQFFPKHWLDDADIAFSDFPSRIGIGYVLRREGAYSYLMQEELASLEMTLEQLHSAALSNLARLPSASISIARVPSGPEGWIAATDDNFAAVRILLPKVQVEFSAVFGAEFLFTLTNRDDCFCWSMTQEPERQERHARRALEDFLADDYNLTPDIFSFSQEVFRLHRQQRID
jgi:hypothetical protein